MGYCSSSWVSSGKTLQKPDVSIITGSYSVATPKIKLFSIINLYALRLWHISGGYKHSSTLYRNPVIKTTSEGPKSVQTFKSDHGNRFSLQDLVFIRIQEGGHCPENSHDHSGIKNS